MVHKRFESTTVVCISYDVPTDTATAVFLWDERSQTASYRITQQQGNVTLHIDKSFGRLVALEVVHHNLATAQQYLRQLAGEAITQALWAAPLHTVSMVRNNSYNKALVAAAIISSSKTPPLLRRAYYDQLVLLQTSAVGGSDDEVVLHASAQPGDLPAPAHAPVPADS